MRLLSFVYRFVSNFVFLAVVYFSLNYIEKYQNRAVLAIVVLVYAGMRAGSKYLSRISRIMRKCACRSMK